MFAKIGFIGYNKSLFFNLKCMARFCEGCTDGPDRGDDMMAHIDKLNGKREQRKFFLRGQGLVPGLNPEATGDEAMERVGAEIAETLQAHLSPKE